MRLTIQEVAVHAVDAPLDPPLRNSLNVIPRAPLVIAEVRTHQGVSGNAYVFPYTPVALGATAALVRNIGAGLTGREVAPATLWAELHNAYRILGTEGLMQIALSCLDMALWDSAGAGGGAAALPAAGGGAPRTAGLCLTARLGRRRCWRRRRATRSPRSAPGW
ncbi:hypothetical protein [Dankookia sp. P2]|uniref:hypothetical protein n=1 Tax=Dankookia sp. P2 TaxID=3423955 RepID=UPI003D672B61